MARILCPTRGGKESHPNQDFAIALAQSRDLELLFLYVSDARHISKTALPLTVDIQAELDEMGEFMLAMAQERANKKGVKAEILVMRGDFNDVLHNVIQEQDIGTVILGSSSVGTGLVTTEYIKEICEQLCSGLSVEAIVVSDGEVVYQCSPDC